MVQFAPDGAQGRANDLAMRRALADSLAHVAERADGHLRFERAALERLIAGLRRGAAYPPTTFAIYYELVPALLEGRLDEARDLLAELARETPREGGPRLLALGEEAIAQATRRYQAMMDTDPSARFAILPPPPEVAAGFAERYERAVALMRQALPELYEEFAALVREVVMVVGRPEDEREFDGGSSYMLWGALFLNATSHTSDVAMIEAIAHESAHGLLFGYTIDAPLVANPDEERFVSPLREDPRPMDGIYHATFVLARMHWAMTRLLDSGLLDPAAADEARRARETDRRCFEDGYETVMRHAALTPTGAALMQVARDYMGRP